MKKLFVFNDCAKKNEELGFNSNKSVKQNNFLRDLQFDKYTIVKIENKHRLWEKNYQKIL